VIGTGPTLLQRVASTRRVDCWKWASKIYGTCTDLYDDDIIPSVMLCVPVFLTAAKRKSGLFGKAESAKVGSCLVVF
jgi:hypothetical protein